VRLAALGAVALGGALGGLLRWGLGEVAPDGHGFPWTTFAINVSGSLALALLPVLPVVRRRPVLAAGLGPGLLGGYTTFSAYADDARSLLADDRPGLALAYVAATLVGCVLAVALARRVATRGAP